MNTHAHWPPAYTLKKHPKARRIRLKASLRHGLQLIVPLRFDLKHVPAILEENRSWIEKQLHRLNEKPAETVVLPQTIELPALQETWRIQYISCQAPAKILQRPGHEIVLIGDTENKSNCQRKLTQWVKAKAKADLPLLLEKISQSIGLSYSKVTIRNQQTRWGSCSSKKSINLNYKLLFLPPSLAHHVFIHELCHTVHFNHSDQFWALVARFDVNWQAHNKTLRRADQFVPSWLSRYDRDF